LLLMMRQPSSRPKIPNCKPLIWSFAILVKEYSYIVLENVDEVLILWVVQSDLSVAKCDDQALPAGALLEPFGIQFGNVDDGRGHGNEEILLPFQVKGVQSAVHTRHDHLLLE
jgi:hypothetical protein